MVDELAQLRREDPARDLPTEAPLDAAARHALTRILTQPSGNAPAARRLGARRGVPWILAAAAAAVLLAVTGLVNIPGIGGGPTMAYAATPPTVSLPPASPDSTPLTTLADKVWALPDDRTDPQHISTSGWYYGTRIDGEAVTSAVVPQRVELTLAADGSGKRVVRYDGVIFIGNGSEEAWEAAGRPGADQEVVSSTTYGPGEYQRGYPLDLPTTAEAWLTDTPLGERIRDDGGPGQVFETITQVYLEQTPSPAARAALLDLLARQPGVTVHPDARDRIARPSLVVSLESDFGGLPARQDLHFDPRTGALLASETELIETAGKLNVPIPATVDYTLFGVPPTN